MWVLFNPNLLVIHGQFERITEHVNEKLKYSNIWTDGKVTSIRNGDRFVYVPLQDAQKLPAQIEVKGLKAKVFKPVSITRCKSCGQEG